MKKLHYFLVFLGIFSILPVKADLIVLAAPIPKYYNKVKDKIFAFQINYARQIIINGDEVLVLSDKKNYSKYANAIGKKRVLIFPMQDIWMRDFTLTNPNQPVMFRYTSEAQGGSHYGQSYADEVQEDFYQFTKKIGLSFIETDYLNDGGNFVDDYAGSAVLSKKFLADNHLSEEKAKKILRNLTGLRNIAFIQADDQDSLQHADGIVSFVDKNTLVINSDPNNQAYVKQLKDDLRKGLNDPVIYEIITPYDDSNTFDSRFQSACGLYTNMLVTNKAIYFPQFGIPEDGIALNQIKAITTKKIIPVMSSQICAMGGGVRCMSLQLRGKNKEKALDFLKTQP